MNCPMVCGVLLTAVTVAAPAAAQEITWFAGGLDAALAAAKGSKAGLVFLYCWKENHELCKSMYANTVTEKTVVPVLADFVTLSAKKELPKDAEIQAKYGVDSYPDILFLKPDGSVEDVIAGYLEAKEFLAEIARIRAGKETIGQLRAATQAKPDDLALQLKLAKKLRFAGDKAGSQKALELIITKDPKGSSDPGAEAMLDKICNETFKPEADPGSVDLKALKEFLARQKSKRILFLGYDKIAGAEMRRDKIKDAAEACHQAWKNIPPDQVLDWGQNIAARAYGYHKELDKAQLKEALDISAAALKAAEAAAKTRGNSFLAQSLYTHAAVQIVNNLRKEAFATMERAIQTDPSDDNLKKVLERWKDGAK